METKARISEIVKSLTELGLSQVGGSQASELITDLVQRVQYPENFCKNCDDRMFFSNGKMVCGECGVEEEVREEIPKVLIRNDGGNKKVSNGAVIKGTSKADAIRRAAAGTLSSPAPEPGEKVAGGASGAVNWV